MKKTRLFTKTQLLGQKRIGGLTMLMGALLLTLLAISTWPNFEASQVTLFEQIIVFIVMPMYAIVVFAFGLCVVTQCSKRLRSGDYENNSHSSAQS